MLRSFSEISSDMSNFHGNIGPCLSNFIGTIPKSIALLTELTSLRLGGVCDTFDGTIPDELYTLSNLQHLYVETQLWSLFYPEVHHEINCPVIVPLIIH